VQQGRCTEALANLEDWRRTSGDAIHIRSRLVYVYGRMGQKDKARAELRKLVAMKGTQSLDPVPMALAYLGVGNNDAALSSLEKACAQRSNLLTALKNLLMIRSGTIRGFRNCYDAWVWRNKIFA
jgi:Flp pilus assembly protein TadD